MRLGGFFGVFAANKKDKANSKAHSLQRRENPNREQILNEQILKGFLLLSILCVATQVASSQSQYRSELELGGAVWQSDLSRAKKLSQQSGKPLLVFDMRGNLDEDWC